MYTLEMKLKDENEFAIIDYRDNEQEAKEWAENINKSGFPGVAAFHETTAYELGHKRAEERRLASANGRKNHVARKRKASK